MSELTLDAYRHRACVGRKPLGERSAREVATRLRSKGDRHVSPYSCPFCNGWHVGHAIGVETMVDIARLLRARSGNAPGTPGAGTTKRERRKVARREASNPLPRGVLPAPDAPPVTS